MTREILIFRREMDGREPGRGHMMTISRRQLFRLSGAGAARIIVSAFDRRRRVQLALAFAK
jgi:hypothetical protein